MKMFTVSNGTVFDGAPVAKLSLKGAGIDIPAIIVGEEGRGRARGVLPVQLLPRQMEEWKKEGMLKIFHAEIGTTKKGTPKLFARESSGNSVAVVVFRTGIGFRGNNSHTGDSTVDGFSPFPGEILVNGVIAQGDAGRMGCGEQLVAIIPRKVVFRTAYSGRLYGQPSEHYYRFDGDKITVLTKEEREIAEAF